MIYFYVPRLLTSAPKALGKPSKSSCVPKKLRAPRKARPSPKPKGRPPIQSAAKKPVPKGRRPIPQAKYKILWQRQSLISRAQKFREKKKLVGAAAKSASKTECLLQDVIEYISIFIIIQFRLSLSHSVSLSFCLSLFLSLSFWF